MPAPLMIAPESMTRWASFRSVGGAFAAAGGGFLVLGFLVLAFRVDGTVAEVSATAAPTTSPLEVTVAGTGGDTTVGRAIGALLSSIAGGWSGEGGEGEDRGGEQPMPWDDTSITLFVNAVQTYTTPVPILNILLTFLA